MVMATKGVEKQYPLDIVLSAAWNEIPTLKKCREDLNILEKALASYRDYLGVQTIGNLSVTDVIVKNLPMKIQKNIITIIGNLDPEIQKPILDSSINTKQ
jgi:hypothetical protein